MAFYRKTIILSLLTLPSTPTKFGASCGFGFILPLTDTVIAVANSSNNMKKFIALILKMKNDDAMISVWEELVLV